MLESALLRKQIIVWAVYRALFLPQTQYFIV